MNPQRFLTAATAVLLTIGTLGVTRWLGSISRASFFNPPYWINWFHLGLSAFVGGARLASSPRLQANTTFVATAMGLALGCLGLLFGPRAARARWSDGSASSHLGVGLGGAVGLAQPRQLNCSAARLSERRCMPRPRNRHPRLLSGDG